MKLIIDTEVQLESKDFEKKAVLLRRAADAAGIAEGLHQIVSAHVILTDDEKIRAYNRDYRATDRATDVLSFPSIRYKPGQTAANCAERLEQEYDDETDACFLGDIIISMPHAAAQALEYGHSEERETAYLLVHGLFHLMGYDHMTDDDRRRMRKMEEKALDSIGIGRITDEELIALAKDAMKNSYSPYSKYKVGACLLAKSGKVYQGCNIENASYGACNCAERTALFKAVSEGEREFIKIAIAAEKSMPWPCGICRQALNEFAPQLLVLVACGDERDSAPLSALLPHGFGPQAGTLDMLGKE